MLFIAGTAAILYWAFSEYAGVRNIWLLLCCTPVAVIMLGVFAVFSMYMRFGKPLSQIFNAIDSVAEGDLSVRVPENRSDMFSELITRFNKMIAELERADQQRRNLTSDIAHELRTPLHIIQGNLEGIIDGVYEPTTEHINNTLDETKLLARLVNDLQTLSLAESGQLPLHPTRFLLADLTHDLTASFSAQAATLGIDLTTELANPTQEITADYDRLNQVLSNLISNALRHTPKGGTISLETESGLSEAGSVRIKVKDSGEGIASEDLPFIFDRFWRGDKSRTGRVHSGLGLAIAKQIVHAHNGTIEVESEIGRGTTFTIEIPTGHV
ncbi:MAG TPA: HAMP domain-containing sensor histidine kinase [Anaerolineales bacterium]|nr:HAMP domain-containing sensor histidine kinase [Anaerolineales bacterium]HMV96828.1 HAMP domain-containing sensor histidine kinase [Anaerolineales bacterium]HMX73450.1 HAMP domain-containing sensor histidine kinase [Anaerolineales bacterium]HMZ42227.1 HAMP domain-containing sensor histidine kinase [Anaerolineales bacterium]HNA53676.1 HAMP domain-containing sensor histidine kinase [Anaerolineales bacterium]